jgi:zinc protease
MIPSRAAVLAVALALASAAQANPHEFSLANGLRLIVKEDHRAPTVVHQVWYRVGSMDEAPGATGLAHVLEHMMFKGTRRHGPGEFSRLVAEAGGRENAFTSTDFTVYHEQVHRDRLPLAMRLEADRMANLVVRPEEFAREIKVVMEERRLSYEDRPRSLLYENLLATAFAAHPYKWPTIGWMQDLQNMSWEDAQSWYRRWYAPGNATVIVVGDVEPHQVLAWARRYYGVLPRRTIPGRKALAEPAQRGPKRVTLKAPAELPYLRLGYKVPALRDPANDWEPFAISLIAEALGGNDAARFNQILVRERRIATSADADYELISRGPGMLFLDAAAAKGRSASELEEGIREIVARVAAEGLSSEELERAKVQRLAQLVYRRDSFFAQALELGELESAGLSFRDADRIAERFKAISLEQVRAAAARYLVEDGLTVAVLDPQPLNPRPAGAAPPAARH